MKPEITISFDLEDHRQDGSVRFYRQTTEFLKFLDDRDAKATFFVTGDVAKRAPKLIREIFDAGHEVAYHSSNHRPLTEENAARMLRESSLDLQYLHDLTGTAVVGYRAPSFSMTSSTLWAIECLKALGIRYSSSVLPAKNPVFGFPEAPSDPFQYSNGIVEFPCPTKRLPLLGPVPFLGGIYLRYIPRIFVLTWVASQKRPWTYLHPYDFDCAEPFIKYKGVSSVLSFALWRNRSSTLAKLSLLLDTGSIGKTFKARLEATDTSLLGILESPKKR